MKGNKRRLTDEREREIAEAFRGGETAVAISRRLGYSRDAVYRALGRAGLRPADNWKPGSAPRLTPEEEAEVVANYQTPMTIKAAGRPFGLAYATTRKILGRHKVLRLAGSYRVFREDEVAEMVTLWDAGWSQTAIGKKFGTSQIIVSRLLRRHCREPVNRHRSGENHGSWKGGRTTDSTGYVRVIVPRGHHFHVMADLSSYVLEHRLVMAEHLGRPLVSSETVHHINGDRADNRLENLQLRNGKHGRGIVLRCADCGSCNVVETPIACD